MSNNIQDIITTEYQNFKKRISQLIPKVDEDLVLQILKFQTMKEEWPGSVTLRIKYQKDLETDLNTKKEKLYEKYKMLPSEMDDRTLRFKALGVYIEDISELSQDPEVEYISGSAEPSQKDQFASAQ
jgi:Fe-S-cluster formation regulator IscX/YfhJ